MKSRGLRRSFALVTLALGLAALVPAVARAATAPGAPTSVVATPGNARAAVKWRAPASDGGAAITGYTATASGGGGHSCTTTGALTCTVAGLTNGTSYTFTVTATNSVGTGPASSPSAAVTPAALPGAPTHVVATAGHSQATVTWSAPASNGGAPIRSYTVAASGTGGQSCTWTSGALTCIVTGLINGQSYTFTVRAANTTGAGPASAPSNAVLPTGAPQPPTGVSATPGDQAAVVNCTAPTNNGGAAITSYTATASPGGAHASAPTCPITVTGLTDGVTYTFTVTATNSLGTSAPSAASVGVKPADTHPPTPPSALGGKFGGGALTLFWHGATDNVGVSRYEVFLNGTPILSVPSTQTTATTHAFEPKGRSVYTVRAFDAAGNQSAASNSVVVRPTPRPRGVPKIVPRWAWQLFAWQRHHRGARPKTPKKLPAWYASWKKWRGSPFELVSG